MSASLPKRPSLASLKKQAKQLLALYRSDPAQAGPRIAAAHPRPESFRRLSDAQLTVAREYGFASWRQLAEHVAASGREAGAPPVADQFLDLACLTYGDDSPQRIERALALLREHPQLASTNVYCAAATGQVEALQQLLTGDGELATRRGGPRKWPALLYLCYARIPDQVTGGDTLAAARLLLDRGADPNAHYLWGKTYRFTALTGAMGEGEGGRANQPPHQHARALAELLLQSGADANDAQGLYNTIFEPANDWLRLLLAHGLNREHRINWKTRKRIGTLDFILGHAVTRGFRERVEILLEHGADATGSSYYNGRSHHTNALLGGFTDIAALLVARGAKPAQLSVADRFQAACMAADETRARALLEEDGDALLRDAGLLGAAASVGNRAATELLLRLGADVNAQAKDGSTALHQAAWHNRMDLARLLVASGARPIRDTAHDSTPAGWAAYGGHVDLHRYLLAHCRDQRDLVLFGQVEALRRALAENPALASSADSKGNTLLHHLNDGVPALPEVVAVLLAGGADPEARNGDGETALESAQRRKCTAVAAALQDGRE